MDHQLKADRIAAILEELYALPPVPLRHSNPFQLLVAVVLSAQTAILGGVSTWSANPM